MEQENMQLVKYTAKDGVPVALDFETVKNYLVRGQRENITRQEVMYFLGTCKSKGLNPFKGDCYLIKYGQDPAAIVTSIEYYRSRAKAQEDCAGWEKGIIVLRHGEIVYSNGLLLEGDELLGGWFEAKPHGWERPFKLEVNLRGFVKKTREGNVTKFWEKEKQPMMIAKIAESQGLRTLWPDEFGEILEKDEVPEPHEIIDVTPHTLVQQPEPQETLDAMIKEALEKKSIPKGVDFSYLPQYVEAYAKLNKITNDAARIHMASKFDAFMGAFSKWCDKVKKASEEKKAAEKKAAADKKTAAKEEPKQQPKQEPKKETAPPPADPIKADTWDCPLINPAEKDPRVTEAQCKPCPENKDCPAYNLLPPTPKDDIPF
jgi:phage recombination protein Bet